MENQQNSKKSPIRLIAKIVCTASVVSALVSFTTLGVISHMYDNELNDLNDQRDKIYEQFMASEEYSDAFKQDFISNANDYADGSINYDEFEYRIKYLKSREYATKVLARSNSDLKDNIDYVDTSVEQCHDKYQSHPVVNVAGKVFGISAGLAIGYACTFGLEDAINKRRKKITHRPSLPENAKEIW